MWVQCVENSRPDAAPLPTVGAMLRRPLALVVPVLVLALVGCSTPTVIPPAAPPSDEAPLFATDEEALAAATAAYEEFLAVSSQILQDGGAEPERARPYLSESVYAEERAGYEQFSQSGLRLIGQSQITNSVLQQWSESSVTAEIIAYFCVSLEGTDVVDSSGESVVNAQRPVQSVFEIVLGGMPGDLVVERKQIWSDDSACG